MKTNLSNLLILLLLLLVFLPGTVLSAILPHDKIQNGGYILFRNGNILEKYQADRLFIPASTIKLLTAFSALKTLGDNFRFITSFYLDSNHTLYIEGSGDPTLTTESLIEIAKELKKRGVTTISGYVLDGSAFQLEQQLPEGSENSTNPYDVANSGLAVNFNSIGLRKHKDGTVSSSEELTPITPLGIEIGQHLSPGKHRVNINAFQLRETLPLPLRYSAELLHALVLKEGINSKAIMRQGVATKRATMIYQHTSTKSVREIVKTCLHVSNNFMANQLALTAGAVQYGYPATWGKTRKLLQDYATHVIGISPKELQVVEGSGLSRDTKATPAAMLKLLRVFEGYRDLLPLKQGTQLKSGTMKNVYCYAGYLDSLEGTVLFVMLLNQPLNTRKDLLASLRQRFLPKITRRKTNSPMRQ